MPQEEYDHNDMGGGVTHHATPDGMNAFVAISGRKVKSFKGETAWMDAQRHAYDLANQRRSHGAY